MTYLGLDNIYLSNMLTFRHVGLDILNSYIVERNINYYKLMKHRIMAKKLDISLCFGGLNEVILNLQKPVDIFYLDLMDTYTGSIMARKNSNSNKHILINTLNKVDKGIVAITNTTRTANGEKYYDIKNSIYALINDKFYIIDSAENTSGNCKTCIFDIVRK